MMKEFALLLLSVAVAQASVSVVRTSSDGPRPTEMDIEVKMPDSKVALIPLMRTDAFENIPMTVVEKGISRTFSSSQVHHPSHAHYRNIESKSVISVRHVNGKRRISGHVMHEGTSYFLEPIGDSDHKVTKNVMSPDFIEKQIDLGKARIESRRKRQVAGSSTTNTVELQLLLDSTVNSAFQTIYGSAATALTELHFYYTHILNGIDTAYRNIGTPSISVVCTGITISQTESDDTWMAAGNVDGSAILTSLTSYAAGKTADHFMAFTRLDITGDGSSSVCGMAYVGAACTSQRVSINEDQGLHSWGTAAHELGHNLGSRHDGAGNVCNPGLYNLMSPSSGMYTISNVANSFRFSACSVNYMSQYISSLGSSSCLLSAQGSRALAVSQNVREGTRMSLDQVCKLAYPDSMGKFMISSSVSSNPAQICASIFCLMTQTSGSTMGGLRAPVGTPCGNKKSCNWNGQCTTDETAPAADETCFWGDSWPASNCAGWKNSILNNWDSCQDSVKRGCCKTLAGIC